MIITSHHQLIFLNQSINYVFVLLPIHTQRESKREKKNGDRKFSLAQFEIQPLQCNSPHPNCQLLQTQKKKRTQKTKQRPLRLAPPSSLVSLFFFLSLYTTKSNQMSTISPTQKPRWRLAAVSWRPAAMRSNNSESAVATMAAPSRGGLSGVLLISLQFFSIFEKGFLRLDRTGCLAGSRFNRSNPVFRTFIQGTKRMNRN